MMNAILAESARTLSVSGFARYWQYRDLVRNLVVKDLKVRYQGAMLGFFWSLGNPLALILLYDFVFTHVFRSDLPNYILYLVIGVLHYNLFSQAISQSCESLTSASGLIQKIYFPRILVPTSSLLFTLALWVIAIFILVILYPFLGGGLPLGPPPLSASPWAIHRLYLGHCTNLFGFAGGVSGPQAYGGHRLDVRFLVYPHRI